MKVYVLALDGLDHGLVVKWKLKNLLQKTHGNYRIGKEYYTWKDGIGRPYSPLVWTSFITGVPPSIHQIESFWSYKNKVIDTLRKLPIIAMFRGKRRYLSKVGIKPSLLGKADLEVDTLFDVIRPSIAIDVISYNMEEILRLRQFRTRTVDEFISTAEENFALTTKKMFENLSKRWRLFMFYVSFTDTAGHCYDFNKLRFVYQRMDMLVEDIKEAIEEECIFLIASDHGMTSLRAKISVWSSLGRLHIHSNHGFFSISRDKGWKPTKVTDFFPRIVQWIKE